MVQNTRYSIEWYVEVYNVLDHIYTCQLEKPILRPFSLYIYMTKDEVVAYEFHLSSQQDDIKDLSRLRNMD